MQQSLVLLYAQLIHSSPGPVVSFLANTTLNLPGVNGAPPNAVNGLNFLLTLWTKEQENFEGDYTIKVTYETPRLCAAKRLLSRTACLR